MTEHHPHRTRATEGCVLGGGFSAIERVQARSRRFTAVYCALATVHKVASDARSSEELRSIDSRNGCIIGPTGRWVGKVRAVHAVARTTRGWARMIRHAGSRLFDHRDDAMQAGSTAPSKG
jgi:hypothetical protein